MSSNGHWLARAGALIIVVGFLLPSVAVSCTVLPGASTSLTLSQIAGQLSQPLLYLVPLGALAVLLLAFLPPRDRNQAQLIVNGQIVGVAAGVLSIFIALVSVAAQIKQAQVYSISPDIGLFVLVAGYGLAAVGIFKQYSERGPRASQGPPMGRLPDVAAASPAPAALAKLDFVKGDRSGSVVTLHGDTSVGRGAENQLQLSDQRVSRQHIWIRYAQGAWFVQDQNSSGGTYLNGKRVPAARLSSGDHIRIGETVMVFRD